MINRPKININDAFALLQANGFQDVETETCDLAIEPGQRATNLLVAKEIKENPNQKSIVKR